MPYLGHVISRDGLKPDPNKIAAIKVMKSPTNQKELKRFLGMVSYLSKFLPSISQTTSKLRELDKKDSDWIWMKDHEEAYQKTKQLITAAPVLRYYDQNKELTL